MPGWQNEQILLPQGWQSITERPTTGNDFAYLFQCQMIIHGKPQTNEANSWFTQLWLWDDTILGGENFPSFTQNANGTLNARIGNSAQAAPDYDSREGEVFFLVMEVLKTGNAGNNFDRMRLYVNPSTMAQPAFDASRTLDTGKEFMDFLGFRTNSAGGGDENAELYWGELRVGDSWNAVVIPEPRTYALLIGAIALLGTYVIRRSRR